MEQERIENLLNRLAQSQGESIRPDLSDDIKNRIHSQIGGRHSGLKTVNIIINLRVSRLAAAAVIVITILLWAGVTVKQDPIGGNIYQDSKLLIQNWLGGPGKGELLAGRARYEYLLSKGKEVVYYGNFADLSDRNALLLQWKLSDGSYRVIFTDLREETVDANELVRIQARMLQKGKK